MPGGKDQASCVIAEVPNDQFPQGLTSVGIDELPATEITAGERGIIEEILAGNQGSRGPFSRAGWIEEAKAWLRAEVGPSLALSGEVRQYNATGTFALVRFGTRPGQAYWLKGTGGPNAHEFQVTRKLAELCPNFLPIQIAERVDWNAWLMEDAGQPAKTLKAPQLRLAVVSMASLQKSTVGSCHEFLSAGAADQSVGILRGSLVGVIEYLDEVMVKQTSTRVPRLERRRLLEISAILEDACFRMEDLRIPDALIHNDLNSGNILFSESGCVFTDWCESCVGNPFFAFQQLCLLQPSGVADWSPELRTLYTKSWLKLLDLSQIDAAFRLSPLLAIFSHLYGRGTWMHSPGRSNAQLEAYARSLARHMDRAAQDPLLMEAL